MHQFLILLFTISILYYFTKSINSVFERKSILFAFIFKIGATLLVWYIYTYHFSDTSLNDIYKYFNDGKVLNQSFAKNPQKTIGFILTNESNNEIQYHINKLQFWTKPNQYGLLNDNQTIILINFLLCFISNTNILIQSLLISIISFYATLKLYKTIHTYYQIPTKILLFTLFLNPPYLIWASGNFKETFIYIGLAFFFKNLIEIIHYQKTIKKSFYLFINMIFILFCKNYLFIFLVPGIIGVFLYLTFKSNLKKSITFSYLTFLFSIILMGLFYKPVQFENNIKDPIKRRMYINKINQISYEKNALGNNRNIFEIIRFKQQDQQFEASLLKAKTVIYLPKLDGNPRSFLYCIPIAIFNTIFRPNFIDLKNILFLPDLIFNIFLWGLIILTIKFKKSDTNDQIKIINHYILNFSLFALTTIGIIVPVLGNIVRYRAPILPFIAIYLISQIDFNKIPIRYKL